MQFYFKVNDAHMRSITSVGYNPFKHEIVTGAEDGLVKFWELETGLFISSNQAHQGWVTSFLFWKSMKTMFSSSHDCTIALWQANSVIQIIYFEEPFYKLCLDNSELFLMVGTSNGLHLYTLDKDRRCGSYIDVDSRREMKDNSGIVRCIVTCDNRVFCAGFDRKLVLYDCVYYGTEFLKMTAVIRAHESAITSLCVNKDSENNIWIVTGGFDKMVKIWNSAGKLVHRIDGFSSSIVDICALDRTKQIWVSTGSSSPFIFDIKSGEDVSQFSNNFQKLEEERFKFQQIKYFSEIGMVIATTNRRHLLSWRSQISSAVTRLVCGVPIDCLCLGTKPPLLIFCGIQKGKIIQWEKRSSNEASYQIEVVKLSQSMKNTVESKLQSRQFQLKPSYSKEMAQLKIDAKRNKSGKRFLKIIYVESKDILLAAAEDGVIYVFGYDVSAIESLLAVTKTPASDSKPNDSNIKGNILPTPDSKMSIDPVTMRITGLTCQHVLLEHKNVVSGIVEVPPGHGRNDYFLLSCSWDQRICLWSLEDFELVTLFQNDQPNNQNSRDIAANDVITCVGYSASNDQFAYASADFVVRIRKFSLHGSRMTLITEIDFKDSEITVLSWINSINSWITASEDHLIKIWSADDSFSCTQSINAGGPVSSLCYDDVSQILMASVGHEIKLFDIIEERMVQVNCGHDDDIADIVILPGKHQFASAGEDGLLLIWNSWQRPRKYNAIRYNEE